MSEYTPDVWVVIKVTPSDGPAIYRVLAGWYGGYLNGDSWKINSGITEFTEDDKTISFGGYTGSVYRCHKGSERFSGMTGSIFEHYSKELEAANMGKMEHISYEQFKQEFTSEPK